MFNQLGPKYADGFQETDEELEKVFKTFEQKQGSLRTELEDLKRRRQKVGEKRSQLEAEARSYTENRGQYKAELLQQETSKSDYEQLVNYFLCEFLTCQ